MQRFRDRCSVSRFRVESAVAKDLRDAIIGLKKDAKLVAAAKNERTNSPEGMYREFTKLPVDRQKEIAKRGKGRGSIIVGIQAQEKVRPTEKELTGQIMKTNFVELFTGDAPTKT